MKITDLRIGNLIQTISEEPDIIVIDKIDGIEQTVSGSGFEDISIEDLTGIPLTKNYILENGFIQQEGNDKKYIHKETNFELLHAKDSNSFLNSVYENKKTIKIKCLDYVHQLQNFFYRKEGIELYEEFKSYLKGKCSQKL